MPSRALDKPPAPGRLQITQKYKGESRADWPVQEVAAAATASTTMFWVVLWAS